VQVGGLGVAELGGDAEHGGVIQAPRVENDTGGVAAMSVDVDAL
jgi:hypothetical protein